MPSRALSLALAVGLLPAVADACRISIPGTRCVTPPDPSLVAAPAGAETGTEALPACRMSALGGRCIAVQSTYVPPAQPGDILERGKHSLVMNTRYWGLPAPTDGWVYMRIEDDVYRVDWDSHRVIERATDEMTRRF